MADVEDFKQCLLENELEEVRAVGAKFTWTNNQEGGHRISSNIDRCFANSLWFSEFSHIVVERLARGVSDHCPQLLSFGASVTRKGLFKFYNVLAEHVLFEQIVGENWGTSRSQCQLRDVRV